MTRKYLARMTAVVALLGLLLLATVSAVQAGGPTLSLTKSVGGYFAGKAFGRFNLAVHGVTGIQSVTYEIDGSPMATVTNAPYGLAFDTGSYPLGSHTLTAAVKTADGTVKTDAITVEFVTASSSLGTWLPLLLVIILLAFGVQIVPSLLRKGGNEHYEPGATRNWPNGGAICPKCHKPFPYSFFGANMLLGKLLRCPYCGHWAVLRRASQGELDAADVLAAAEAKPTGAPKPVSEEEKLRRQIDDSRYQK